MTMLRKSRKQAILILICMLCLLAGCRPDGGQMCRELEQLEQRNSDDLPMLNDSLAEALVDYFDRHGSANEKMRAKYILGRTYYDLGELPHALETYNEAADCADTTATDCDFAKLSRVHAQMAMVFYEQVQARSQLEELRLAEYYAKRGEDSLMAIECYLQQSDAYDFLHQHDSIVFIIDRAARMFAGLNRPDRAAQAISTAIPSLLAKGDLEKARVYCNLYEKSSGYFDGYGNIEVGREIYYYIKGQYYLAINKLDSAEILFRKELLVAQDVDNQIAGCKGLQEVYERRKVSDSIAKYATHAYELNDSAYSLSEMQNVQRLQASYNYIHQKQLAAEKGKKAEQFKNELIIAIVLFAAIAFVALYLFKRYKEKKAKRLADYQEYLARLENTKAELQMICGGDADISAYIQRKHEEIKVLQSKVDDFQKLLKASRKANLEERIIKSEVVRELNALLEENPVRPASDEQLDRVRSLINELIPIFYDTLNSPVPLRSIEYEVCLLVRCHFKPAAICKLIGRDDGYIANLRKGILLKVFGMKGAPRDLDKRILQIV